MRQNLPKNYEQRRDRAVFVSPGARASNPGDFQVEWSHFFQAFPLPVGGLALGLIVLLALTLKVHPIWALPFLSLLLRSFFALKSLKDHFAFGNALPGIIAPQGEA